jgi:hypothetical protein
MVPTVAERGLREPDIDMGCGLEGINHIRAVAVIRYETSRALGRGLEEEKRSVSKVAVSSTFG